MAQHLKLKGYSVKASTTSENRLHVLEEIGVEPFILDIESIPGSVQTFLHSDLVIVNIPSRNVHAFKVLVDEIEKSPIKYVILVSSTSVYSGNNSVVSETDSGALLQGPLHEIEKMFGNCNGVKTTVVRLGGLIGYNRNPGRFFSRGRIVRNPESRVNLIHRDDCIGIITKIIDNGVWGEEFNCCADSHPTKKEFYTYAARSTGENIPEFAKTNEESFKIISNQKVKEKLNYRFVYPDLMKIPFT